MFAASYMLNISNVHYSWPNVVCPQTNKHKVTTDQLETIQAVTNLIHSLTPTNITLKSYFDFSTALPCMFLFHIFTWLFLSTGWLTCCRITFFLQL